ncbi:MAG: redoxin family protein [Flavobacteriales bacterium]|nr:redoxin family protein [Flavobacteriales bacterium]
MKNKILLLAALGLVILGSSFLIGGPEESIALGTKAPMSDHKMMGIDDKGHTLASLAGKNGLLVIFSCNTCPFVIGNGEKTEGWEGRYAELYKSCTAKETGMVLINSNEAKRDAGDSMDDMKHHAKEQGYAQIPYVIDTNHQLADAFGAKTTPHVFLFNANMELIYKGAIDDNVDRASEVEQRWLINALRSNMAGKTIDPAETRATGCSIKRVK